MKELATENLRLRGLVSNLFECLRSPEASVSTPASAVRTTDHPTRDKTQEQARAARIAAEKCGGAVTGRFAALRVNP